MYEHEIRWYALIPDAILIGLLALTAEICDLWFRFPARPDWLWCLAFVAMLGAPPVPGITAFAVCGLVRDLLLGPRLGPAMIAYILVGMLALHWRVLAMARGWISQALVAGVTAIIVSALKHILDYGPLAYKLSYRIFFTALGDGALTALAYLPLALVLSAYSFRPWRERRY